VRCWWHCSRTYTGLSWEC